jgi:poly-gamma-glutamate capsule biosynthesis protein CapA/YwtB (metallophosphatase superfamily)
MRGRYGIFIGMIVVLVITYFSFISKKPEINSFQDHSPKKLSLLEKTFITEAVVGGIGDILIHSYVYNDAYQNGTYNFTKMFEPIRSLLSSPDFLIANQESIAGGVKLGVSTYPQFNTPYEITDALLYAGVDMVTNANNHTLDKGEQGVLSAISYYEQVGMPYTGMFKNEADRHKIRVMSVNGIQLAVLSYTYGTNGIPVPKGKSYLVNLLDEELMVKDIQRAKELADVIILSVHWGNEYQRIPTDAQKHLAQKLLEAGADIIFGHHPHVLQPIERLPLSDGRTGVVFYSLGNFLSGQWKDYKDLGGMGTVTIKKTVNKQGTSIDITDVQFYPTYVYHNNYRNYRVYPLEEAVSLGIAPYPVESVMKHLFSIKNEQQ